MATNDPRESAGPNPDTALPKFTVTVNHPQSMTTQHLNTLLDRFADGQIEPVVLGRDPQVPEAAIIPFDAFVRLMQRDHAEHVLAVDADNAELVRRIQDPRPNIDGDELLDDLEESLSRHPLSQNRDRQDRG